MAETIRSLKLLDITKTYPGITASDHVSLEIGSNEILALLGENGAGKTTLMNILFGLTRPDAGQVLVNGKPVRIRGPRDAFALGIGMVHQHFMLVDSLTVAENVALGLLEGQHPLRLDLDGVRARVREVSARHDLRVDPDARVSALSVGEKQRVELVKVLALGARFLILDEPTAVLTPQETEELLALLSRMAVHGCSIIFISHKLNEVKALSHRVAVLRLGKVVYTGRTEGVTPAELASLMAGRDVVLPVNTAPAAPGEPVLEVHDLRARGNLGHDALTGLSLTVHRGEILGIAGVSGNGQRELAEAVNGLRRIEAGSVAVDGRAVTGLHPRNFIDAGMGYVPEERNREGTVPSFSVRENLILKDFARAPLARGPFLRARNIRSFADSLIASYDVRCASPDLPCRALSGGNIQKVILARELSRKPKVLVAAYPTRGLDIGATEFIHRRMLEAREAGMGILYISEELDELLNLCDRIAVIYNGSIIRTLERGEADRLSLGIAMAGMKHEAPEKH